jgi:hypothetical protein
MSIEWIVREATRHPDDVLPEYVAVYIVLRSSGQSSTDAVEAMSGMHVHAVVTRLTK